MEPAAAAKAPSDGRGYPFQVRGTQQTLLSLRLLAPDDPGFFDLLLDKVAHAPEFYRDAPVVLDVAPVAAAPPIDLERFVERLRSQRLVPIGVQNAPPAWQEAARRAGLAVLAAGGAVSAGRAPPRAGVSAAPPRGPGLVVAEPVRGGQQIHGPDGDVTVLGPVGHGAEIAAAGHIHVYGSLRGRAFAGINGDQGAMIFCDQLEAELLSIAGLYLVNEDIDPRFLGRRVRVHCEADRLVLAALG